MKKGNEIELLIEDMEFPSQGIGYRDDLKIYVKNAFPGQTIRGKVTKKRADYAELKLLKVVEAADYELEQKCPHYAFCGGCSSQNIPYEKQLEFKKNQVLNLFKGNSVDTGEFLGIENSPIQWEYRNKMEFTFGDMEKGGDLTLGMHMKGRSFGIVTVDQCHLVDEDYRKILDTTVEFFKKDQLPHYKIMAREGFLRNLIVRKTKHNDEILINIVTTTQINYDFKPWVEAIFSSGIEGNIKGIIHTENDSFSEAVIADKVNILYGVDFITEELLGLKFKISPFSFFQTNSLGAAKLYSIVRDFMGDTADNKVVFDLYCGTGTIGQIAAGKAKKVIGVELIEEAVVAANENAKLNGLNNCTFIAGDVAKVINTIQDKPDIIILDPPRSGVHPVAMNYVIKFDAKDIIYVSCNPKTLVTDLKVLEEAGYKTEKTLLMDMFPNTPHVETVVKLVKK
ncbi:23S rRNA (uracil(1939)-C(5))-methyltransferase RlmD [Clostridium folliculivorans]|uniref:23S rRNA (Uracil-5-)-methyltransferase RumA n=1 Tax=Clostridium folliculivorans TaxID=2886038 RepID=A0A9W5XYV8_9CLOT|nr:23S rRNA (uracil(1939)-C(5))-methyltransferase RlmD [Clostridium folliculivorans]GKU23426.1 23S rRNA (uracil-5-)-methyltransferase RumA [Clostridium folliculivorans]GKU29543.1 23S rRNA (uracil-5-)-methyltransferase RumA [Clostridium folliculivorans]